MEEHSEVEEIAFDEKSDIKLRNPMTKLEADSNVLGRFYDTITSIFSNEPGNLISERDEIEM